MHVHLYQFIIFQKLKIVYVLICVSKTKKYMYWRFVLLITEIGGVWDKKLVRDMKTKVRGSSSPRAGKGPWHQFGPKRPNRGDDQYTTLTGIYKYNGVLINECGVPKQNKSLHVIELFELLPIPSMFQDFSYFDLVIIWPSCYDNFFLVDEA